MSDQNLTANVKTEPLEVSEELVEPPKETEETREETVKDVRVEEGEGSGVKPKSKHQEGFKEISEVVKAKRWAKRKEYIEMALAKGFTSEEAESETIAVEGESEYSTLTEWGYDTEKEYMLQMDDAQFESYKDFNEYVFSKKGQQVKATAFDLTALVTKAVEKRFPGIPERVAEAAVEVVESEVESEVERFKAGIVLRQKHNKIPIEGEVKDPDGKIALKIVYDSDEDIKIIDERGLRAPKVKLEVKEDPDKWKDVSPISREERDKILASEGIDPGEEADDDDSDAISISSTDSTKFDNEKVEEALNVLAESHKKMSEAYTVLGKEIKSLPRRRIVTLVRRLPGPSATELTPYRKKMMEKSEELGDKQALAYMAIGEGVAQGKSQAQLGLEYGLATSFIQRRQSGNPQHWRGGSQYRRDKKDTTDSEDLPTVERSWTRKRKAPKSAKGATSKKSRQEPPPEDEPAGTIDPETVQETRMDPPDTEKAEKPPTEPPT